MIEMYLTSKLVIYVIYMIIAVITVSALARSWFKRSQRTRGRKTQRSAMISYIVIFTVNALLMTWYNFAWLIVELLEQISKIG